MLHYISSGKTFDDVHISSLNKYITTASERFSDWFLEGNYKEYIYILLIYIIE